MNVSRIGAFAVVAAVALLSARAEAARLVNFNPGHGVQKPFLRLTPDPFRRTFPGRQALLRPESKCPPGAPCGKPCLKDADGTAYVFASDDQTGNLYQYCEDMPPSPTTPKFTFKNYAGAGLAVSPSLLGPPIGGVKRERLAMGTLAGTVSVYNVANIGALNQKVTLTLGGGANTFALGLCFDGTGGLYATNYPSNEIDYFNNAAVTGPPGPHPPTAIYLAQTSTSNPFYGFYLACDYDTLIIPPHKQPPSWENIVMVDGIDNSGNVDVGLFGGTTGSNLVTIEEPLGAYGPNFPGGMAINKLDNLIVSDWFNGDLIDFGPIEPWKIGSLYPPCRIIGFSANSALPIAFDDTQREIWTGNPFTPSTAGAKTDAASVYYPFGTCTPGESGGPTTVIPNEEFVGIAVWPNTGI